MQPRYFPMLQTRASRMTGNSTNETPTLVSSKICAPRNELVRLTFPPVDVKVLGRVEECEISEFLVSIVVSIPACHAGDRGSIPRRGVRQFYSQCQTHSTWRYLRCMRRLSARRGLDNVTSLTKWNPLFTLVHLLVCVRMADRSMVLQSGRCLVWKSGFESHF